MNNDRFASQGGRKGVGIRAIAFAEIDLCSFEPAETIRVPDQTGDRIAPSKEQFHNMTSDKSCPAGYQYARRLFLLHNLHNSETECVV
jgi:hypothetical protein